MITEKILADIAKERNRQKGYLGIRV